MVYYEREYDGKWFPVAGCDKCKEAVNILYKLDGEVLCADCLLEEMERVTSEDYLEEERDKEEELETEMKTIYD